MHRKLPEAALLGAASRQVGAKVPKCGKWLPGEYATSRPPYQTKRNPLLSFFNLTGGQCQLYILSPLSATDIVFTGTYVIVPVAQAEAIYQLPQRAATFCKPPPLHCPPNLADLPSDGHPRKPGQPDNSRPNLPKHPKSSGKTTPFQQHPVVA